MNDYLACEEDLIKLKKSNLSKFDAVMLEGRCSLPFLTFYSKEEL